MVKSLERIQKEMVKLREENRRLSQESKKGASDAAGAFKEAATSLAGYAAQQLNLVNLVREELQLRRELRKEAADTQKFVGASTNDIIRNMGGQSQANIKQMLANAQQLAKQNQVDQSAINAAVVAGLGASGQNITSTTQAVDYSSRLLADRPEAIARFTGSLLDLSQVTGTTDARVNAGLLGITGSMSRVTDPQQQAMNIAPALIGASSFGATPQQSAAAFATITAASGDFMGATGKTGLIALSEQMRSFMPAEGAKGGKKGGKMMPSIPAGLDDFGERLEYLQQNPAARRAFLGQASFEKTVQGPVERLLDPNSDVAKLYRQNLATFPTTQEGLRTVADDAISNLNLNPYARGMAINRIKSKLEQQMELGDLEGGNRAELSELTQGALRKAGVGWPSRAIADFSIGRSSDPQLRAENIIGSQAAMADTRGDKEIAKLMREAVNELRALNGKAEKRAISVRPE